MAVRQEIKETIRPPKGSEGKCLVPLSPKNSGIKRHYEDWNCQWCLRLGSLLTGIIAALVAEKISQSPLSSLKPLVVPMFKPTIIPSKWADSTRQPNRSTIESVIHCGVIV
jgi:hypothetical protein